MNKYTLIGLITLPIWLTLGYFLFKGIYSRLDYDWKVKDSEKKVIEKLKIIRDAEEAFLKTNGRYTADCDSLADFIMNGDMFILQRRDSLVKRPKARQYLGDSTVVIVDTLGKEKVMDKLFPKSKYPNFDPKDLCNIPNQPDKKFVMSVGKINKGVEKKQVFVDVIEVYDPFPFDSTRNDKNERLDRKFLRFGSMTEVTTAGNWE